MVRSKPEMVAQIIPEPGRALWLELAERHAQVVSQIATDLTKGGAALDSGESSRMDVIMSSMPVAWYALTDKRRAELIAEVKLPVRPPDTPWKGLWEHAKILRFLSSEGFGSQTPEDEFLAGVVTALAEDWNHGIKTLNVEREKLLAPVDRTVWEPALLAAPGEVMGAVRAIRPAAVGEVQPVAQRIWREAETLHGLDKVSGVPHRQAGAMESTQHLVGAARWLEFGAVTADDTDQTIASIKNAIETCQHITTGWPHGSVGRLAIGVSAVLPKDPSYALHPNVQRTLDRGFRSDVYEDDPWTRAQVASAIVTALRTLSGNPQGEVLALSAFHLELPGSSSPQSAARPATDSDLPDATEQLIQCLAVHDRVLVPPKQNRRHRTIDRRHFETCAFFEPWRTLHYTAAACHSNLRLKEPSERLNQAIIEYDQRQRKLNPT